VAANGVVVGVEVPFVDHPEVVASLRDRKPIADDREHSARPLASMVEVLDCRDTTHDELHQGRAQIAIAQALHAGRDVHEEGKYVLRADAARVQVPRDLVEDHELFLRREWRPIEQLKTSGAQMSAHQAFAPKKTWLAFL
jgi:hypothetical protein